MRPVLYLDTNHISEIARHPDRADSQPVVAALQGSRAALAITLIHFVELSDPGFSSFTAVRDLLRSVPVAWTGSTTEVWDSEIAVACARARGITREPPRVFHKDALDWSRGPSPTSDDAGTFLEDLVKQSELREGLLDVAKEAAQVSMIKTEAVLVKEPVFPLRIGVQDHLDSWRARNWDYALGLDADDIIRSAGGPPGFPSLHTYHSTLRERLKLADQKSTKNDVFDEYHAAYAPYAAVTALDRATVSRLKAAGLNVVHRVTAFLSDVPGILERVERGAITPVASATW